MIMLESGASAVSISTLTGQRSERISPRLYWLYRPRSGRFSISVICAGYAKKKAPRTFDVAAHQSTGTACCPQAVALVGVACFSLIVPEPAIEMKLTIICGAHICVHWYLGLLHASDAKRHLLPLTQLGGWRDSFVPCGFRWHEAHLILPATYPTRGDRLFEPRAHAGRFYLTR